MSGTDKGSGIGKIGILLAIAAAVVVVVFLLDLNRGEEAPETGTEAPGGEAAQAPEATETAEATETPVNSFDYAALPAGPVGDAVRDADRPEADRLRDSGRKPHEVLAFSGISPGMRVLELGGSTGYYTRMISNIVGPEGRVLVQQSERFWPRIEAQTVPLYEALGNVDYKVGSALDFEIEDGSLDVVFVALLWHHMHYNEASGETLPESTVAVLDAARRWLKPDGTLLIVEHEAAAGSGRAESAAWHRTPAQMTIDDVTAHGFAVVGASDALANPDDDLRNYWREALPERDSSQRFILKFTRPGAEE